MAPELSEQGEAPANSASSGPDMPDEEELAAGWIPPGPIMPPVPLVSCALVLLHLALAFWNQT